MVAWCTVHIPCIAITVGMVNGYMVHGRMPVCSCMTIFVHVLSSCATLHAQGPPRPCQTSRWGA